MKERALIYIISCLTNLHHLPREVEKKHIQFVFLPAGFLKTHYTIKHVLLSRPIII